MKLSTPVAVLAHALLIGCAGGSDAVSREVVSIRHLSTAPIGALAVSDDSAYEFFDDHTLKKGSLTASEFAALREHTSRAALQSLYVYLETDPERCSAGGDAYLITSKSGTGCFVVANVSDAASRAHLEFLVDLFAQKSGVR